MKKRLGFTLVEVSLFLGITALLFLGVTIGTQNAINTQRQNDAVNGFVDFLKNVYSEVSNPQSTGYGNSDKAIYGRLVVFGEEYSIDRVEGDNGRISTKTNDGRRDIFVYDVLGNANESGSSDSLFEMLKEINISPFSLEKTSTNVNSYNGKLIPAGETMSYSPRWQTVIETTTKDAPAKMAILVVRHPRSGTINTLVLEDTMEINTILRTVLDGNYTFVITNGQPVGTNSGIYNNAMNMLKDKIDSFSAKEIDLCINIFGDGGRRRDVRIVENARNAGGVILMDADGDDNKCN